MIIIKTIKNYLLFFLLIIFKYHLRFIYFFIKFFSLRKKRILLLSRQKNTMPLNYLLLTKELDKKNIKYIYFCKKVPSSINVLIRNENKKNKIFKQFISIINYYFSIYRQMCYCATSKIIIVDGYNVTVSLLYHKKGTKIIQLWHAHGAIKKFGYQTIGKTNGLNPVVAKILCMHKNYDYVISGSKAMNVFFAEAFKIDINKIIDIGTPIVDYMKKKNINIENKLYKKYPQLKEKKNIIYAPTFRNDGSNNINKIIEKFDFNNYNLIPILHPKYNNIIKNDKVVNIDKDLFNTYDIIKIADYVITDYSALIIDSAIMNKKVLLYVYDYNKYKKENGLNLNLFAFFKNNISEDFSNLMDIIKNNKYDDDIYNKFKIKYINNYSNCTKSLVNLIEENL